MTIFEKFGDGPEFNGIRVPPEKEVGIEIEMEGHNLSTRVNNIGWTAHHDGSLRGEAVEYVTIGPVERDHVGRQLQRLQLRLNTDGAYLTPSDRCGVHIHINCQSLTPEQVINFAGLYLILEDVLVRMCGEDREGNLFCLRARDAEALIRGLRVAKQEGGALEVLCNDNYRYASLNLSSLKKYGSVEFRAMRTPRDFGRIETWANILLRIKDQSLYFRDLREMVESMSLQGVSRFIDIVLGEYAELVHCPDEQRMLMEGVRRVQEIAYAPVLTAEQIAQRRNRKPGLRRLDGMMAEFERAARLPANLAFLDEPPVLEEDFDEEPPEVFEEIDIDEDDQDEIG